MLSKIRCIIQGKCSCERGVEVGNFIFLANVMTAPFLTFLPFLVCRFEPFTLALNKYMVSLRLLS